MLAKQQCQTYLHHRAHAREGVDERADSQRAFRRLVLRRDLPQLPQQRIYLPWMALVLPCQLNPPIDEGGVGIVLHPHVWLGEHPRFVYPARHVETLPEAPRQVLRGPARW